MGSWTQMVNLKASAQSEWKYSYKPHDFRSWQQPEVKSGNDLLFLDTKITRAKCGLLSRKWYFSFVATCTSKWFYLQLLAFSMTKLWDLSSMCTIAPTWYSIMQLKCMFMYLLYYCQTWHNLWISSACRLGHRTTSWWSLQSLGGTHVYL
jgi:hypothetical protein